MARRKRTRRARKGLSGASLAGCSPNGIKANGRLRKKFRWAKNRKRCAIPAR